MPPKAGGLREARVDGADAGHTQELASIAILSRYICYNRTLHQPALTRSPCNDADSTAGLSSWPIQHLNSEILQSQEAGAGARGKAQ